MCPQKSSPSSRTGRRQEESPNSFLDDPSSRQYLAQWRKSNVKFAPPVVISREALSKRLQTAWTSISAIARGKAKKADKEQWEAKLDKLLDVTVCQCEISVPRSLPTAW